MLRQAMLRYTARVRPAPPETMRAALAVPDGLQAYCGLANGGQPQTYAAASQAKWSVHELAGIGFACLTISATVIVYVNQLLTQFGKQVCTH